MHIPHPYTDSIRYIACWCHMNIVYYQGPSYFTNSQGSDFPSLLSVQKIHEVQAGDLQRAKGAWATSLRTGYAPRCFHTTDDSMTTSLYENDIRRGNMGETMKKRCLFQVCTVCWLPPFGKPKVCPSEVRHFVPSVDFAGEGRRRVWRWFQMFRTGDWPRPYETNIWVWINTY